MIKCEFENGQPAKGGLRHVVMDVIVLRDGQVLLQKRAAELLEGGKWALAGGYLDRDETILEGARREVLEETGWEVKDLTLLKVRDNPLRRGEDRQNVAFLFFAEATKKTGEPDWESDEQRWFGLDALPPLEEMAFDHLNTIELYKRHMAKPAPVPVLS